MPQIHYKDIGDCLSRAEKLRIIGARGSIAGIPDWRRIAPDAHHDWLAQRDPAYQRFMPLGIKSQKLQADPQAAFSLFSPGISTARDPWIYSFDRAQLRRNIETMAASYEQRLQSVLAGEQTVEQAGRNDAPTQIRWTGGLRDRLRRREVLELRRGHLRRGMYRPFCKTHVYFEPRFIERVSRIPAMFPTQDAPNQVIGTTGRGETVGFSALITDTVPNHHLVASAQWFARYRYEALDSNGAHAWFRRGEEGMEEAPGYRRVDNITDWCLQRFRARYPRRQIDKDDIWFYLYGVLHAPDYRTTYRADLSKDLPRVPFAPDFGAFRQAGAALAALHLGYETGPAYALQVETLPAANPYQLGRRAMQWGGTRQEPDRSTLHVTPAVTLRGIPPAAHGYVVNGRTPLEWAMDRLRIRQDKESGIVNDPNAWFAADPAELVAHLKRLVHVSVETTRIVDGLPAALGG